MFSSSFFKRNKKNNFDYQPLEEIIVTQEESSITTVNEISQPYNFKHSTRTYAQNKLHIFEIQECIDLLENSKIKLPSYIRMKEFQKKFFHSYSWFILLASGSSLSLTFTLMYKLHSMLTNILQQQLTPLLQNLASAISDHDKFTAWYNRELEGLNQKINEEKRNCNSEFDDVLSESALENIYNFSHICFPPFTFGSFPSVRKFGTGYLDCCSALKKYEYTADSYPKCYEMLGSYCEAQTVYFNCLDGGYKNATDSRAQFVISFSSNVTSLHAVIDNINASISPLNNQSTWEPISTFLFGSTCAAWTSYLLYLIKSWHTAQGEYNQDLEELLPLDKCLSYESQLRIRSLITHINGFYLYLLPSKAAFEVLENKNHPFLIKSEGNKYVFRGKDKNDIWRFYNINDLIIPKEWMNKKRVFISVKDKLYDIFKTYHSDSIIPFKKLTYQKLIEKLKAHLINDRIDYEAGIAFLLATQRYHLPTELTNKIIDNVTKICEDQNLTPILKF